MLIADNEMLYFYFFITKELNVIPYVNSIISTSQIPKKLINAILMLFEFFTQIKAQDLICCNQR